MRWCSECFFSPGFPGLFGGDEDACAAIDNAQVWCRMGGDDEKKTYEGENGLVHRESGC